MGKGSAFTFLSAPPGSPPVEAPMLPSLPIPICHPLPLGPASTPASLLVGVSCMLACYVLLDKEGGKASWKQKGCCAGLQSIQKGMVEWLQEVMFSLIWKEKRKPWRLQEEERPVPLARSYSSLFPVEQQWSQIIYKISLFGV